MMHDKMAKMKLSKSERNGAMPEMGEDDYPYGLSIRLENAELDKLGMKKLPAVGEVFEIEAYVKVTGISESQSEGNKGDRSVTLQITEMSIEREAKG